MQDPNKPYNLLGLLKAALKTEGIKASHLNQNYPDVEGDARERLQVTLPIGRTIHLWVKKNKLIISSKARIAFATYAMDVANPANDPGSVIEMFKNMCKAQIDFINKCEKL